MLALTRVVDACGEEQDGRCENHCAELTAQSRALDPGEHEDRDDHRTNKDCPDRIQSVIRRNGCDQRCFDTF